MSKPGDPLVSPCSSSYPTVSNFQLPEYSSIRLEHLAKFTDPPQTPSIPITQLSTKPALILDPLIPKQTPRCLRQLTIQAWPRRISAHPLHGSTGYSRITSRICCVETGVYWFRRVRGGARPRISLGERKEERGETEETVCQIGRVCGAHVVSGLSCEYVGLYVGLISAGRGQRREGRSSIIGNDCQERVERIYVKVRNSMRRRTMLFWLVFMDRTAVSGWMIRCNMVELS
ncbi:hypothetical protein EJ05DRAFT_396340 [Pseudovirgaria hyperparasitica]|uniref:Uncharacterized protein n=1 Tax=Pseudovirgaria hyperparasitica TaxID=470096 RepID=A0A6A6W6I9_9PEZI|nr:uncharacterized protein EJ05DRAFT_396340 [Pseudovirgaria hyperparasitica]KAF2757644.1 hypothetical protein EJ05DRAFT_396340 [Pseudovirgaria hyperparasitica]